MTATWTRETSTWTLERIFTLTTDDLTRAQIMAELDRRDDILYAGIGAA